MREIAEVFFQAFHMWFQTAFEALNMTDSLKETLVVCTQKKKFPLIKAAWAETRHSHKLKCVYNPGPKDGILDCSQSCDTDLKLCF